MYRTRKRKNEERERLFTTRVRRGGRGVNCTHGVRGLVAPGTREEQGQRQKKRGGDGGDVGRSGWTRCWRERGAGDGGNGEKRQQRWM